MDVNIKVEFNELAKSVTSSVKMDITNNIGEDLDLDSVSKRIDALKELQLVKAKELFNDAMSFSVSKSQLKQ